MRPDEIVAALRAADVFDAIAADLVYAVDEVSRVRLNAGESEVFGSTARLWEAFKASLDRNARDTIQVVNGLDQVALSELFERVVAELEGDGDLFFASDRQRCRSRAFEFVHYLRNLRQRTHAREREGVRPRLVEQVKVEVRRRERPIRKSSANAFVKAVDRLGDELDVQEGWDIGFANDFGPAILGPFVSRFFPDGMAKFQVEALRRLLRAALGIESGQGFVITAGTGFGKTEAFLLPALSLACLSAARRARQGAGVHYSPGALLLYPRVDLCNNQLERTLSYILALNQLLTAYYESRGQVAPQLKVSISHGSLDESFRIACPLCRVEASKEWSEEDWARACITARKQQYVTTFECMRQAGNHAAAVQPLVAQTMYGSASADLAITTIDTLHRRLMDDHGTERLFRKNGPAIRLLVADEMHIYEGQTGSHAAHVLRRARRRIANLGAAPICIGASATISKPADLAAKLFGVAGSAVIQPGPSEKEERGVEYFLFARAPGNRVIRPDDDPRTDSPPADDEDGGEIAEANAPGREGVFVAESATAIQSAFALQHAIKTEDCSSRKRRTLGFVDSVDGATRLGLQIANAEWQDFFPRGLGAPRPVTKSPLYALRLPVGRDGVDLPAAIRAARRYLSGNGVPELVMAYPPIGEDCPRRERHNCRQPPHHLLERCERYQSGECWFAMGSGAENLWPAAVQMHSAKTRLWGPSGTKVDGRDKERWRILLSTSSLEVGFDHPEISATWQYHAPPSIASFVQRKGRGGRGVRDYPITLMVLGPRSNDSHAFHDHRRFVEADDLECYLDERNPSVRTQHVFAAVMDYCAAMGRRSFKDPEKLPRVFGESRRGIVEWVSTTFEMPQGEAGAIVDRIAKWIQTEWCGALDNSAAAYIGTDRALPFRLFHPERRGRLEQWKQALDPKKVRTRAWIDAALGWIDQHPESTRGVSVVDLCAATPLAYQESPDLRIPESTIPVPLGGNIEVRQTSTAGTVKSQREAADFALRSFLPGGFKIRYGSLLMAPWRPAPGVRRAGPNQSWAATLTQLTTLNRGGLPRDSGDLLARAGFDDVQREDIVGSLGGTATLAFVESLRVDDLGTPRQRRFVLDEDALAIYSKKQSEQGAYTVLAREPNVSPLSFDVPRAGAVPETVFPRTEAFGGVSFHRDFRAVRCQYGNLVHCYPTDGEVRTLVVRFYDEGARRPLIAAAEMRTQAVEFHVSTAILDKSPLDKRALVRSYWRRVQELLAGRSLLEQGVLPSLYSVEPIVAAIQIMSIAADSSRMEGPQVLDHDTWAQGLAALGTIREFDAVVPLLARADIRDVVIGAMRDASEWARKSAPARVLADTFMGALSRMGARLIGVSVDTLVRMVVLRKDGAHLFLLDGDDGGSGSARRICDELRRMGVSEFVSRLLSERRCRAALVDGVVAKALSSKMRPDVLAAMACNDEFPGPWFEGLAESEVGRAKRRLGRLVETPALAAFNVYLRRVVSNLEQQLGSDPPDSWVVWHVRRTPALDVRAEGLRQVFLRTEGGVSELGVRVADASALCVSGCPECVGADHWREAGYADRTLLDTLAVARGQS